MANDKRPTIREVAKLAGASTAAVSRVLREAYGVSDEMTVRVKAAMKELGYRPHASARGMRGHTYTIGVVHPDLRNTFFPDIITAIAEHVLPTSRQLFLATSEWTSTEGILTSMYDGSIEGVVLIAPNISDAKLEAAALRTPLVVTHRHSYSSAYDTIVSDDDAGALMVVEHLAGLGHRKIVHFGPTRGRRGTAVANVTARRTRGYRQAMEKLDLGAYADVIECEDYRYEDGYRVARALFESGSLPTAIFAGTDNVAFGILQAAFELGIDIPQQMSLVGYDNTGTGALGPISLTSVDQGPREIGLKAGELLLSRIGGRRVAERMSYAPTLVVRGTTAPPG